MSESVQIKTHSGVSQNVEVTFPDGCPICHRHIHPIFVAGTRADESVYQQEMHLVFRCPNRGCQDLFIGVYVTDIDLSLHLADLRPKPPNLRNLARRFAIFQTRSSRSVIRPLQRRRMVLIKSSVSAYGNRLSI